MKRQPDFDAELANRWFAADYFNRVWELLEKVGRTPDEDERMISLCHASLSHWQEWPNCTNTKRSIGYWQLARVYAILGQADNARHYAELCLRYSQNEAPFYRGYAHEALARAAQVAGNQDDIAQHLREARRFAAEVTDEDDREALENDLADLS